MKKRIGVMVIYVLISIASFAQEKPGWIYNKPVPANNSYLYIVESATGLTELEARNQAFARVFQSTAMRIGQPISSDEINRAVQSGTNFDVISAQYNIPINKVCEYTEKQKTGYRVYILCQAAKSGNILVEFDDFNGCYDMKNYKNSTALLRSAIIPGLGQMGKNRYGEGLLTLTTEVVLVGGGIGSYVMANKQKEIVFGEETTQNGFLEAKEKYNTLRTINIASWSAAAALYVYNLYRAYTIRPKYRKDIAFNPVIMPNAFDLAYGVCLTYYF